MNEYQVGLSNANMYSRVRTGMKINNLINQDIVTEQHPCSGCPILLLKGNCPA